MSIQATGLVKAYRGRRVVNGVDLRVDRGEVVGLLGPNGAGKTTTFYMIMGLERCDAGRIELDGVDVTRLPMYKRARLGIGYLAQEASVFRKLTVEENLLAILEAVGVPPARRRERVDELLHEFGIEHVRHSYGYQLSGGERRRTEIARALAAEPSFLLLDEPFAGVDPIAVADLQEIIAHLKTKGLGLLITDHNVRETLAITDRAYIMHEGRILVEGDSKDIANDPVARKFYLGERFQL
ncbi:MAG: LPS export ABC transporter ATP-binding protein [Limnochordales bacterium]|jgi:ABC-type (unclassified) transport system, ATPase component|nr:LPS export ABC transporter ATP-binding protein [Bacillota bacterium]